MNEEEISYVCGTCKRGNCKLWRTTNVFLEHINLFCITCIAVKKPQANTNIDKDGMIPSYFDRKTDQVGGMVPAVPTSDRKTFWGYTSVPEDGVRWWTGLPN